MDAYFRSFVKESTNATEIISEELIQQLWSGYGEILRLNLKHGDRQSVVVKHVQLPRIENHPRGWNSEIGHQRKIKSYRIETTWYGRYSNQSSARVPECISVAKSGDEVLIILEDLDITGYPIRKQSVSLPEIDACLEWLAKFHASFLGIKPEGLWDIGSYWHLDTRPEELLVLDDQSLKKAAPAIDQKLNTCTYKTFVHGDAKLANFCFSKKGLVAAVDFQYVGGGCGVKDVAYFVGSCLDEKSCEKLEGHILDTYFKHLQNNLSEKNPDLESEWRSLYRVAWADFHRFLKGWSPSHWKINSYSERITREVIKNL